jgi:DNA-binding MarR family transcriptional regulator
MAGRGPDRARAAMTHEALAAAVISAALDLRRVLRRHLPVEGADATLTAAQSEVLHDVTRHPGSRIREVAERLRVAPNTVSTIVKHLGELGLLDRRPDPTDGRAAALFVTTDRTARRERRSDQRALVLAGLLDQLAPADRATLEQAVPVLNALVAAAAALERGPRAT